MTATHELSDPAATFHALHVPGQPVLMPNPWSVGTARLLESLGFAALGTTSSGHAATLGRPDGSISKHDALEHAADIAAAVQIPVSADLENGFADAPEAVATTVAEAAQAGLAGCSIEDFTGDPQEPIYDHGQAAERVAAAAHAVDTSPGRLVLTARAENFLHGNPDLADTITRLQSYQQAGADVLYAPGLTRMTDIQQAVAALDRPLNVLARPGLPSVPELARCGVARISVGGAFHHVALAALTHASHELLHGGTYGFLDLAIQGREYATAGLNDGYY